MRIFGNTCRTGWLLLPVLLLICLQACHQEEEALPLARSGGFLLSLSEEAGTTRTAPSGLGKPVKEQFRVRIVKEGGREIYDGAYTEEPIPAPLGNYTLTASCGTDLPLGLDAPYYEGTAVAGLTEAQPQANVDIRCRVANALLSVNYVDASGGEGTGRFDRFFSDFGVKVTVGSYSLSLDNATASSAYFPAGSDVALQFHGTLKDPAGKQVTYDIPDTGGSFTGIPAGSHLVVSLSYAPVETGVVLTVEKVEVRQETITETIPLEWLPAPKLTGFADGATSVTYTETADALPASIGYTASAPLQDLELTLDFRDGNLQALNGTYTLSTLSDADKAALADARITLPAIGAEQGCLDFTEMTSGLLTDKGAEVENTIRMRVKANNRWSEEGCYTIRTVKPEFVVSVYPGNLWTREFTVNELMEEEVSTGSYAKLRSDMGYQYSADGRQWTTIPADRRQAGLAPATSYYVRGIYRGEVPGEAVPVKTYPLIELANGNLSEYSIVRGKDGNATANYGAQYEWTSWTTVNEKTTEKCTWTAYNYNSRSATRPVADVRSGSGDNTAVWIMTMGYGYGGTLFSPKQVVPGELVYDAGYQSHPTGVNFYCKYTPYDGDESDITVRLYSGDNVIGEGSLKSTSSLDYYDGAGYTIDLDYDESLVRLVPDRLLISFKSGTNSSYEKRESGTGSANPMFRGSELYVDDVSLVYDK